MNRITWRPGSLIVGAISDIRLFSIAWGGSRSEHGETTVWHLSTRLPIRLENQEFETIDQAKRYAEVVMGAFLRRIGASWDKR